MFKRLQKKREEAISSPCNGIVLPLEQVKDTMFSQKMLGDGIAIQPCDSILCAPCDGEVTMFANTLHAFGLVAATGVEILIHVGLDTVNLQGQGFEALIKAGSKVKKGDPILKVDLKFMEKKQMDLTTPIIITNCAEFEMHAMIESGNVVKSQGILSIKKS